MERWLYKVVLRCRSLFRSRRVEEELDEELHFHLDRQIQAHLDRGLTKDEAIRAARLAFGGLEHGKKRAARRVARSGSTTRGATFGTQCACFEQVLASRWWSSCLWRWASGPTRPSFN